MLRTVVHRVRSARSEESDRPYARSETGREENRQNVAGKARATLSQANSPHRMTIGAANR